MLKVLKQVFLVRHGEDRGTGLNDNGKAQATMAGEHIAKLIKGPVLIITSPLQRAVETADIIKKVLIKSDKKCKVSLETRDHLDCDNSDHWETMREIERCSVSIIVVSHQPVLEHLTGVNFKNGTVGIFDHKRGEVKIIT